MSFNYKHRKKIILIVALAVLITTIATLGYLFAPENKENIIVLEDEEEDTIEGEAIELLGNEVEYIQVDIKGQVNSPGTYKIEVGMRVLDAINLAGGLTNIADTSLINLSKRVYDEMVIIIYSSEEIINYVDTKTNEEIKKEYCSNSNDELGNDACIDLDDDVSNGIVNINLAGVNELMTLSGIGQSKAEDIVNYREEFGLFVVIDDLMNVPGIGESIFDSIKENITV